MVIFWIHKFLKNEDVSVIEYKFFDDTDSILLPELTICFWNPFMYSALKNLSKDAPDYAYRQYLVGDNHTYPKFKQIRFDKATLDLSLYVKSLIIGFRPETKKPREYCQGIDSCPFVSFKNNYNGFVEHINRLNDFIKCFGFSINKMYSKEVNYLFISFNKTFSSVLQQFPGVQIMMNYPGQLLMKKGVDQSIWTDPNENETANTLNVDLIEMLIHRDKLTDRCLHKSKSYDDMILELHMKEVGCRAPYHSTNLDFSICETSKEMKEYVFNGFELPKSKYQKPCHEMTYLSFKHTASMTETGLEYYPIMVFYPDKIKHVKQSQAIDIHSIIGNIGGYIGLFLGN